MLLGPLVAHLPPSPFHACQSCNESQSGFRTKVMLHCPCRDWPRLASHPLAESSYLPLWESKPQMEAQWECLVVLGWCKFHKTFVNQQPSPVKI